MRRTRLFVSDKIKKSKIINLSIKQTHYVRNVMRLKNGLHLNIFNGKDGEWVSLIENIDNKNAVIKALKNTIKQELESHELCLCFPLVKRGTLVNIIRQATELGVTTLQPILTDYTTIRTINSNKIKACAIEAAEQCQRMNIPQVLDIITFYEACNKYKKNLVICDTSTTSQRPQDVFPNMNNVVLMVGPEGGFSVNELKYEGTTHMTLGKEILRVDTAVVSALTYLRAFLPQ